MQIKPTSVFRNDINGLRAWAVGIVVLYHFGVPGFGGGFVGVDVFFVISGFLMTSIIVRGLERNGLKFSILSFYLDRARRILPALIALCGALLIGGWWLLIPPDYKALGGNVATSITFLSNIQFWREAGYFDTASHEKLLLHTWSLAVEWQFYLLFPVALLSVWRLHPSRAFVATAVTILMIASLTMSVILSTSNPNAAFYLLPARAWEMLAGGLVYLTSNRNNLSLVKRQTLETLGVVAILASALAMRSTSPWPGWLALIPVIGTAAVLWARFPESKWTGNSFAQWIGTRSYSIYLWHWPLVVIVALLELKGNAWAIAAGLVATLIFGSLSFWCVESPSRRFLGRLRPRWSVVTIAALSIAVSVPALALRLSDGIWSRFSPEIARVGKEGGNSNPRMIECSARSGRSSPECVFGGHDLHAIVLGDSHATSIVSAVSAADPDREGGTMQWSYSACPTLLGAQPSPTSKQTPDYKCSEFLSWTVQRLSEIPKNVPLIIANRSSVYIWGNGSRDANGSAPLIYFKDVHTSATPQFLKEYRDDLIRTTCILAEDRPVYLMRPIPEMKSNVPNAISRALLRNSAIEASISIEEYMRRHGEVIGAQNEAKLQCGAKILDPVPYLCAEGRCKGEKDGRPLYWDDNHLSEYGNKMLIPMFKEVFSRRGVGG